MIFVLDSIITFAGRLITIDNTLSYQSDDGSIAKNVWVWIDDNRDSIAECYRFNEDGLLAKNYVHYDGKMTNDKGQLLEDGVVVRKMTSTGRIITNEDIAYGPKDKDREEYLYGNVLIPKSIDPFKNIVGTFCDAASQNSIHRTDHAKTTLRRFMACMVK